MTKDSTTRIKSTQKPSSPSFVKLAMRNMVKKGSQSLFHFSLTAISFVVFILLVAVLGKPTLP